MNWKVISRYVGIALLVSALFMLISLGISILDGKDSTFAPLLVSFLLTALVGAFPFIFVHKTTTISLKEGYVIIVLSWLLSFVFGMLPYALWGGPFNLENAWFESVSGFTTTGATTLAFIEEIPHSLLFWRSSTHFIGGLGVVVFLLLIIPPGSPVRLRLTNMELSSVSRGAYRIRAGKTVYVFAYVYLGIGLLAFVSYLLAGMPAFDALNHAMSVCATGGFSTRSLSIAAFGSPLIEFVTIVFMLLASLHFGLLYISVATRSLKPLGNPVVRFFLISFLSVSLLTSLIIRMSGVEPTWGTALWHSLFQIASVVSTTGFAVCDNSSWPMLANVMMLFMAIMCGCAGSTTGGVKADRMLVLGKSIGLQVNRILKPTAVSELRLGGRFLKDGEVAPQILYIALYAVLLALSVLLTLLLGMNNHNAFAASISCLSNVGPAIQELGSLGNFADVPAGAKLVFTLDMFLGRVEIYPVLAVVAMVFERRRG
ncbi:MAG: TrkH family potassium uptake protein [Bacteroidales bacterium]|nr:TrkH family potassium uptake protein [Bacteroidales bacterium]